MAKRLAEFQKEGGGWRIMVTVAGREFFCQDQLQPHRGESSNEAKYLIRFHIPFDLSSDSNTGNIWIYNLRRETIKVFERNGVLKLEASYHPFEKHRELIFNGTIEDCLVDEVDKATRTLRIFVGDGTDKWPVAIASKEYQPGIKASIVAQDLIENDLKLGIGKIDPKVDPTYRKGLSLIGAVRPMLEMLGRDMRSKLHVSRRLVYILAPVQGIPSGVLLKRETGLLSIKPTMSVPEDFQYVAVLTEEEHPVVYEIKALLTPKLWADSEFTLESIQDPLLNGVYRVIRGAHDCDGRNFLTSVWCVRQ